MKYGDSMFRQVSFILAFCGVLLLGSRQSMALIEISPGVTVHGSLCAPRPATLPRKSLPLQNHLNWQRCGEGLGEGKPARSLCPASPARERLPPPERVVKNRWTRTGVRELRRKIAACVSRRRWGQSEGVAWSKKFQTGGRLKKGPYSAISRSSLRTLPSTPWWRKMSVGVSLTRSTVAERNPPVTLRYWW